MDPANASNIKPIIIAVLTAFAVALIPTVMNASVFSKIGGIFKKKKPGTTRIENTVNGHPDKIFVGPAKHFTVPETALAAGEAYLDGKRFVCLTNASLCEFEHKEYFRWYLVVEILYDKLAHQGMPQNDDIVKMQDFFDDLDDNLLIDRSHPNALLLGRITGDGASQSMWYVNNPELANAYLQGLIKSKKYPFDFYFEMVQDPEWKEGLYWLTPLMKK